MTVLIPTTELEAVNQLLDAIGETPVSTLANNGIADAATARRMLHNVSRQVQSMGWHWNTDFALELVPSIPDGFLIIPANTLKVDTVGVDAQTRVVRRGSRLYSPDNHTYVFTKSLKVDLVSLLPFEELPETARNYITLHAARRFQESQIGSSELSAFNRRDELIAWANLQHEEADTADYNLKTGSDSVMEVLRR